MKPASVGFHCPSCLKEGAASIRQPKAAFGGAVRAVPLVPYPLIGPTALVFLPTTHTGPRPALGRHPTPLGARPAPSRPAAPPVAPSRARRWVAGRRVRTTPDGQGRPSAGCYGISCWPQNRRAVTVLNASS